MDRAADQDIVRYQTRFFPGDIYAQVPDRVSGIFWSTWGVVHSETGVYGDPTVATAETGQALFTEIVKNYTAFLREYYAHDA
jgi:creatinine amidohydrolase/Fe(II)-dependent formamide hydrolase-like protein